MAIYHLSVKPVQRSHGRSATGAAAYRSGERIEDQRTGEVHDYTKKQGVEHSEIITPNKEIIDRGRLWNLAELAEKRKDGTPAREYEVALPEELSPEQRLTLVRDFGQALAGWHGCAVDLAIHAPGRNGDHRNHHAHIMCTTRRFEFGGALGSKCDVELSDRDRAKKGLVGRKVELELVRAQWAHLVNRSLERAGCTERVSHENLEKQGVDRQPTIHLGPTVTAMERRGVQTALGEINRQVKNVQTFRAELAAAETFRGGIERMKAQARQWKDNQEKAQQEKERLEAERKALEKERQKRERAARQKGRGIGR